MAFWKYGAREAYALSIRWVWNVNGLVGKTLDWSYIVISHFVDEDEDQNLQAPGVFNNIDQALGYTNVKNQCQDKMDNFSVDASLAHIQNDTSDSELYDSDIQIKMERYGITPLTNG